MVEPLARSPTNGMAIGSPVSMDRLPVEGIHGCSIAHAGELLERTEAEVTMDQTQQKLVGRDAARVAWCAIIARLIWGVLTLYEVIDEKLG